MIRIRLRVALVIVIIGALWILSILPAYASPEEAARQSWTWLNQNDPYPIEGFNILDEKYMDGFTIVLATFSQNHGKEVIHNISFVTTKRDIFGWHARLGGSIGKYPESDLVLYAVESNDNADLVYGQILSTDVALVEVAFVNGESLSDSGTNRSFAILFPQEWQFAELRVRDHAGNLLETYTHLNPLD